MNAAAQAGEHARHQERKAHGRFSLPIFVIANIIESDAIAYAQQSEYRDDHVMMQGGSSAGMSRTA